jgi:hypothetical protein
VSPVEILKLSAGGAYYRDITYEVQQVLDGWSREDMLPGDALCCIASATSGVGVLVSDFDPNGVDYHFTTHVSRYTIGFDLSSLRATLARTSEIFLVRGAAIRGGRRIYVYGSGPTPELTLTIL